jgi:uncharacterized protein YycO
MAARDTIVSYVQSKLGDPYRWGAVGPNSFDCSGLVSAAYAAAGQNIGRPVAAALGRMGQAVGIGQALPGDVVYFDEPGATDHVGIYIGGGRMIDAPYSGTNVRVDPVGNYTSIRRIVGDTSFSGTPDPSAAGADAKATTSSGGSWASDALGIGLKLAVTGAAVVLVVLGAKQAAG